MAGLGRVNRELVQRQGGLFADGSAVRHFAVLSNLWTWKPEKLIEWHREKAGTVEMVHDVLKNELAAGVLPSKSLGANAAWLRLAALAHNVLVALKRLAMPADMLSVRPKRLRFLFLHTAGRVICHARKTVPRLAATHERLRVWIEIGQLLPLRTEGTFPYRRICKPFSGAEPCLKSRSTPARTALRPHRPARGWRGQNISRCAAPPEVGSGL